MKTLYININGEAIRSDNSIEVIGSASDCIVDSFYIFLGESIADGVVGFKHKPLVTDFAKDKPEAFKTFTDQWKEVKALLLGEKPSGDYEFTLSSEYLDWLKMNATYSTIYYKKYQNQHQAIVNLNLDELYEDTVDAIRRKVIRFLQANDNYKNYDEFVVNDDAITRRSQLVRAIKEKFEDVAFVSFEKWESSRKVEDEVNTLSEGIESFSTEGVALHDILNEHPEWFEDESLDDSFYKGKTVNEVKEERYDNWGNPISKYFDFYGFIIGLAKEDEIKAAGETRIDNFSDGVFESLNLFPPIDDEDEDLLPAFYRSLGVNWHMNSEEIKDIFVKAGFKVCHEAGWAGVRFESPYSIKYREQLDINFTFSSYGRHEISYINLFTYSHWKFDEICPECGTNDVEDDGSGYLQYRCNKCGHVWGDEEENDEVNDYNSEDIEGDYGEDSYDNQGNAISKYFEINGVILGKTTRQEIVDMGGKLLDGKYGKYDMPDHTRCFFHDNSLYVNVICIYNPSKTLRLLDPTQRFPAFYENYVGLSWNKTDDEIIDTLENLGFEKDPYEYFELAPRLCIWCNEYNINLRITVHHSADTGELYFYEFDCKQD